MSISLVVSAMADAVQRHVKFYATDGMYDVATVIRDHAENCFIWQLRESGTSLTTSNDIEQVLNVKRIFNVKRSYLIDLNDSAVVEIDNINNNGMELELIAYKRIDKNNNIACLYRYIDNSYVVVNGLDFNKSEWNFAYAYDLNQDQAIDLFKQKTDVILT